MTAPSRQTAARRRREQRALSRRLDAETGPDRATIVHTLADGWTVRRLTRIADQHREGTLMRNCLATITVRDQNCWSLRDPEGLPHATFAAWRHTGQTARMGLHSSELFQGLFIEAERVLLCVEAGRALKPAHRRRLLEFARSTAALAAPRLPTNPMHVINAFGVALCPGGASR